MNKKTFLVMRSCMELGGIETYLGRMIDWLKGNEYRIIFIALDGITYADCFRKTLFDGIVEVKIINIHNPNWIKNLDISFEAGEDVLAYSFSLYQFAMLEKIKLKYKSNKFHNFYWVPNYHGRRVFSEEEYPMFFQRFMQRYFGKVLGAMDANNNIIYVNKSHRDALISHYGYSSTCNENQVITVVQPIKPYDYKIAMNRVERNRFNIITVTRFVFPQKAYLIGLIKSYGVLKRKYPQLELTIVGYGEGESQVIKAIDKLDREYRKDIHMVGKVDYAELEEYFNRANLNIGLATTISDGAINGLISLPVRHHSYECEGYGYLPGCIEYVVSDAPGTPIEHYIEEVLNMSDTDYLALARQSYDTYADIDVDYEWTKTMQNQNNHTKSVLSKVFIKLVQFRYLLSGIADKIRRMI